MKAVSLAQNGVVGPIKVPQDRVQIAAIATPSTTLAGATFVLQAEFFTGVFQTSGVFDGVLNVPAVQITGPNQYAWADVSGAQQVQVKRTDAGGGDGSVGIDVKQAG